LTRYAFDDLSEFLNETYPGHVAVTFFLQNIKLTEDDDVPKQYEAYFKSLTDKLFESPDFEQENTIVFLYITS